MALYNFSLDDGGSLAEVEALELPGLRQAQAEAVLILSELLRARTDDHWAGKYAAVIVADAAGLELLRLEVSAPAKDA